MSLRDLITGEKFKKAIGSTTLIKLVLVFSGTQLKYINSIF